MVIIKYAGTVAVLLAAAVIDVRHGKIPNTLLILMGTLQIISEMISRLVYGTHIYSGEMYVKKILYGILVIIFLYPFYMIKKIGAGDIKLLAVSSVQINDILSFVLCTFSISLIICGIKIVISFFRGRGTFTERIRKTRMAPSVLLAYLLAAFMQM